MSPEYHSVTESRSMWAEKPTDKEVDPFLDAYQYAVDVRPHFNRNQLAGIIDDEFLSKVVAAADAGEFAPAEDDPRREHSDAYEGSASDVLGLIKAAMAAKAVGNPDWQQYLPDEPSVREAAVRFMEDQRLSRPFANAVQERLEALVRRSQERWKDSTYMTAEEWKQHETKADMAGVALDAPDVEVADPVSGSRVDSGDTPKRRGTYREPKAQDPNSFWMHPDERPRSVQHVDHESLMIGDTVSVPYVSRDPDTGKVIPGSYTYTTYTMRGTSTVEGELMAVFKNDAGIAEYIPMNAVLSSPDRDAQIRQLLGGVDVDAPAPLVDEEKGVLTIEQEPTAETAAYTAELLKKRLGIPEHAAIESAVFVKGHGDALHVGTFLGFYDEGDEDVSKQPKKYAAIRLRTDEVIGVHADEVKHDAQQERKRTLFRQPTPNRGVPPKRSA